MACVSVCATQDALQFALPPRKAAAPAARWSRRTLSPLAVAGVIACLFFGLILYAKATGHWQTNLPREMYLELVPHSNEAAHPGM
jgi:hypothetical protein